MRNKYFICAGLGLLMVIGVAVTPALAQVMLEQGRITAQVKPGEKVANTITAINRSKIPMSLRVYMEDFNYTQPYHGEKEFLAAGSSGRSCSAWINFSPAILKLEPEGKANINYTINVPQNAQGGYNAVLFVENAGQQADAKIGVRIVTRVGSLFFLETPTSARKTKIEKVAIEKDKVQGQITNLGDVINVIHGTYYFLDQGGMAAERGEVEGLYLPPGKTADFNLPIPKGLTAGDYALILTFDLGEGVSSVVEVDMTKGKDGSCRIKAIRS